MKTVTNGVASAPIDRFELMHLGRVAATPHGVQRGQGRTPYGAAWVSKETRDDVVRQVQPGLSVKDPPITREQTWIARKNQSSSAN